MANHPAQPGTGQRVAALAGAGVLRALFATLRIKIIDPADFMDSPPPGPVIYAFWHNRILAITAAFLRAYPRGRGGVKVLTSASKDGMWLGELAGRLGMGSVRGSSSRRGATAMRELLDEVSKGHDIAITPDGPRGPRYALGPGMIYLAQKAQIPIIPVHAKFGRRWQLRTWDGFCLPQPFSRLEVKADKPIHLPVGLSEEEFEQERLKIESVLRAGAE
ncbi:MAG: lysophospholipid acyltransferase family protein [Chthoniobacterales bacterium]|jgi:lysophospholipid acyltransferase (LPLAT)-like uncharacterized protein|nr:lysophospholipid acyltransferase family protein [Chthoniobacterales bacterium]